MPPSNDEVIDGMIDMGAAIVALLWEPDWDEFHALGVKCIWALGAIGTPDARVVLEDAASVGPAVRLHRRFSAVASTLASAAVDQGLITEVLAASP